jgi:hypothetical protein
MTYWMKRKSCGSYWADAKIFIKMPPACRVEFHAFSYSHSSCCGRTDRCDVLLSRPRNYERSVFLG